MNCKYVNLFDEIKIYYYYYNSIWRQKCHLIPLLIEGQKYNNCTHLLHGTNKKNLLHYEHILIIMMKKIIIKKLIINNTSYNIFIYSKIQKSLQTNKCFREVKENINQYLQLIYIRLSFV